MAQSQTSFRPDNCDGCCGTVDVRHCRTEETIETVHGRRVLSTQHSMLCSDCRRWVPKPRNGGDKVRVVNLRAVGA